METIPSVSTPLVRTIDRESSWVFNIVESSNASDEESEAAETADVNGVK